MQTVLTKNYILIVLFTALLSLGACQSNVPPLSIHEIPVYPGAVELRGEITGADAQAQEWLTRDAQDRGVPKEKITYKRFRLTKGLSNPELMPFYSDALSKTGWSSRWGAVPARQAFTRGSQYLVLYVYTNQTTHEAELLMTLDK